MQTTYVHTHSLTHSRIHTCTPQQDEEMPDFLEGEDGSRVALNSDDEGEDDGEGGGAAADEDNDEFAEEDNERLQEFRARKATLEEAIAELEVREWLVLMSSTKRTNE